MEQVPTVQKRREMPDGVWMKCPGCEETVFRKRVEEAMMVCPDCDYHFTLSADQRIKMLLDEESFQEISADISPVDPLGFKDIQTYPDRLLKYQNATGLKDAVLCGRGKIEGRDVVIAAMDSRFMMASMGSVVGEKITRAIEKAMELQVPFIAVCASGGARMQEGMLSLMQMAKTSAAVGRFKAAGGLYISVFTNPTTAGVLASFASQADIILSEPRATVRFAGPRVIEETIKESLPDGFATAEFLLEHGFIDMVVHRKSLKSQLATLMNYCSHN